MKHLTNEQTKGYYFIRNIVILVLIAVTVLSITSCSGKVLVSKYDGRKIKWTVNDEGQYILLKETVCSTCYNNNKNN